MKQLLDVLATFLTRHWAIGFANAGLTACLGYAVLGAARWARLLSTGALVRSRRWVTLAALFKGAFYLVLGLSVALVPDQLVAAGVQLPDMRETLGLQTQTRHSIWRPTELPEWVKLGLAGTALAMLLLRAAQMLLACRQTDALAYLGPQGGGERAESLLGAAARALGLPPRFRLPRLVLIPAGSEADALPTPFLLGLRRPRLVLSSGLAVLLTDEELEAVFRHELAHLIRRDHWWRWLQLYAEDVARVTLLAGGLSKAAVEMEENLCDRLSVRSARDARHLGGALQKASAYAPPAGSRGGPAALPALLGGYASSWRHSAPLARRLEALLAWSRERAVRPLPSPAVDAGTAGPAGLALGVLRWAGRLLVAALLLLVLYPKYIFTVNLQSLQSPRATASRSHRPAGR